MAKKALQGDEEEKHCGVKHTKRRVQRNVMETPVTTAQLRETEEALQPSDLTWEWHLLWISFSFRLWFESPMHDYNVF